MNTIKIEHTISLSPETIELLKPIIEKVIHNSDSNGTGSTKSTVKTIKSADPSGDVKSEKNSSEKSKKDEKTGEPLTIEKVRLANDAATERGVSKAKIRAVLAEFGVDRSTNLEKDQYAAYITKVNALEA